MSDVLRLRLMLGSVYVMNPVRTTTGINKTKRTSARDVPIGLANALRRIFPTELASSNFVAGSVRRPCATGVQQHLI